MKTLEKQIARIISRAAMISENEITAQTRLSDLGMGSLDQIECVMAVEDTFQIEVDSQALWRLSTVQDVVDAVKAAAGARAA
jgi:acyl carrier protein